MTEAERVKKWRKENPEKWKETRKKYLSSKKGKINKKKNKERSMYGVERMKILERDNYQCRSCGKKEGGLEIHHIDGNGTKMKAKNKNNCLNNLITLCKLCHRRADLARIMEERGITNKWSLHYNKCIECGKTDSKHMAKGVCNRCYNLKRREYKAKYWRENYSLDKKLDI